MKENQNLIILEHRVLEHKRKFGPKIQDSFSQHFPLAAKGDKEKIGDLMKNKPKSTTSVRNRDMDDS